MQTKSTGEYIETLAFKLNRELSANNNEYALFAVEVLERELKKLKRDLNDLIDDEKYEV